MLKEFRAMSIQSALCCLLFTFSFNALSQEATFDGNILAIPVAAVGDQYFSVELTIDTNANSIEFTLTLALMEPVLLVTIRSLFHH